MAPNGLTIQPPSCVIPHLALNLPAKLNYSPKVTSLCVSFPVPVFPQSPKTSASIPVSPGDTHLLFVRASWIPTRAPPPQWHLSKCTRLYSKTIRRPKSIPGLGSTPPNSNIIKTWGTVIRPSSPSIVPWDTSSLTPASLFQSQ